MVHGQRRLRRFRQISRITAEHTLGRGIFNDPVIQTRLCNFLTMIENKEKRKKEKQIKKKINCL